MERQTSYTATNRLEDSKTEAVVVHCGDQRFQNGFHEFIVEGLNLNSFALFVVPGGGHFLSLETYMPKFAKVNLQSLSFFIKRTGARRVILIGHDDCLFFRERAEFLFAEKDLYQKQIANLRKARNRLLEQFSPLTVEIYQARAGADGTMTFVKVE